MLNSFGAKMTQLSGSLTYYYARVSSIMLHGSETCGFYKKNATKSNIELCVFFGSSQICTDFRITWRNEMDISFGSKTCVYGEILEQTNKH